MPNFVTKRPMFSAVPRPPQKTEKPASKVKELAPRVTVDVPKNEESMRKQLSQLKAGLGELNRLRDKPAIERHFVTTVTHKNPTTADPKLAAQLATKQDQARAAYQAMIDKPGAPPPYPSGVKPGRLQDKHYPSPAAL